MSGVEEFAALDLRMADAPAYANLRAFVREDPDTPWRLPTWAAEPC